MSVDAVVNRAVDVVVAGAEGDVMKQEQAEETRDASPLAAERYGGIGLDVSRAFGLAIENCGCD